MTVPTMRRYYSNALDLVEHPEGCLCYALDALAYAEAKVKEAVEKEREACAKLCDAITSGFSGTTNEAWDRIALATHGCAKAIRAREGKS